MILLGPDKYTDYPNVYARSASISLSSLLDKTMGYSVCVIIISISSNVNIICMHIVYIFALNIIYREIKGRNK